MSAENRSFRVWHHIEREPVLERETLSRMRSPISTRFCENKRFCQNATCKGGQEQNDSQARISLNRRINRARETWLICVNLFLPGGWQGVVMWGAIWDLLCHFDQTLQYSTFAKSSLVKDVWAVMKKNRRQVGGILFLQGGSPYQNGVGFRARDITSDEFSHFNRSCEVCAFMETRRVKDGWVTMKGRRQVSAKDVTCFVVKNPGMVS